MHGGGISFKSSKGLTVFSIDIPLRMDNKEIKIA